MALLSSAELVMAQHPDRVIMLQPQVDSATMRQMAQEATVMAQQYMPKLTGAGAASMEPVWGDGWFGIFFGAHYVWYQDHGIRPFTMTNLQGRTIPMWIDDPSGAERAKNPKAKVRTTASGRVQVLIFRRVARKGQTRQKVTRSSRGYSIIKNVPASYPGAAGRINRRHTAQSAKESTEKGKPAKAGQIMHANVGVRWRHPGLAPRMFLNHSLTIVSQNHNMMPLRVYACTQGTMPGGAR